MRLVIHKALTTQEAQDRVPWLYVIIFAAFMGFIGQWWQLTTAMGIVGNPAQSASIGVPTVCMSGLTTLPFMALLVAGAFGKFRPLRGKITPSTLTYIYIISLVCSFSVGWRSPCASWGAFFGARILDPEVTADFIPLFMAPAPEIASQIVVGGIAVPWADAFPSIIFWWIYTACNAVMMLSLATVFRRSWIDIEKVPFPHVVAAHELLTRACPKETAQKRTGLFSPFVIGMSLGVIFQFPILMSDLFPWFPDIYGWRANTCTSGQWYIAPDSPLAGIAGLSTIQKDPLGVAIAYLAPLITLFNIWFWYLVCIIILSQIAFSLGYFTGITQLYGCARIWCGSESLAKGPPFKWTAVATGATFGLTVLIVVLNWPYIVETFNAAFGRLGPEARQKLEEKEPVPYRTAYALLAVSFVVLLAMYLTAGLSLASAFIVQLTFSIIWLALVRQIGIAGFFFRGTDQSTVLARLFLWPSAPEQLNRDFVLTARFTYWGVEAPEDGFQVGGNFISSFAAFRMADLTATKSRNAFLAILATFVVLPLFSLIGWYYTTYSLGLSRIAGNLGSSGCDPLLNRPTVEEWNLLPGTEPWTPYVLLGFIITAALSVLHSRFIWFPFEPIGFSLAISYAGTTFGIWSSALVAWILKTITLRVGGSKLYEKWGVPVATGFIGGYMGLLLLGTVISHIKFWFPF